MKNNMKRVLSLLLVVMMVAVMGSVMMISAGAEDSTVAKIGDVGYDTLDEAFAAAAEGDEITLVADAKPSLTSQRAITKAAVIDLGGKTLTLAEDDLYFGTTTFKNGTIVVDPSVKASTAVFWMFANQTLTFDDVDIVATGVTGTYLIGINGGTGSAVNLINGSSITIANTDIAKLSAVICDNGTGNSVVIDGATITVKNLDGRFYLGGTNGTVTVDDSMIDLDGVKEGFYLRAGQTLAVEGTSDVAITLNDTNGRYGINVTDATATYTKADTAQVAASDNAPVYVAEVNGQKYTSLQEAIIAAAPNGTVELLSDVTVDEWIMFSERLNIGNGDIITLVINGLTINGNNHTLTVKDIESAGNGNRLFYDATNLNISDLTIEYVDAAAKLGGIGLTSGTIENVTFVGGSNAILPGDGNVTVTGCKFNGTGAAIYFEEDRDNLVVTGNTFDVGAANVILLRGDVTFTDNTVVSGRTVNVVSGSPVVTGNNFGNERFKVYNAAAATISGNTINNLVFNDDGAVKSTFATNTLSDEAEAALEAIYVAEVGGQKYLSLEAAINAANGAEITLLRDVTENITIADGATVVLDLNGKTLYGYIAPCDPVELTVSNGSIINNNSAVSAIEINAGKLTLTDVDIDSARHAVRIDGAVTATINGGTYVAGAFNGTGTYHAVNVSGAANVTIVDGTFVGPKGTAADSGSAVNVKSGATVAIDGGNFSGGKNKTLSAAGSLTVYGGTFDQAVLAEYCGLGLVPTQIADGVYGVKAAVEAKIGNKGYATLKEAVEAAKEGDTILLQANVFVTELLVIDKNIKISDYRTYSVTFVGDGAFHITEDHALTLDAVILTAPVYADNSEAGATVNGQLVNGVAGQPSTVVSDGTNVTVTNPDWVAKIGTTYYVDLADAIEAGGNVVLLKNLTIASDLNNAGKGYFNIADGEKVTLDLNGKTINVTDHSTGNFILFYNYGEFTILNGTIKLTATNDRDWNAESAIILNRGGVLNVQSGTYTHNGGTDMAFVVDNSGNYYGDATANIYDGTTLTSSYIAIRNRMEQNSHGASGKAILNVYGGTISGTSRAIWAQAASTSTSSPATGEINVTGGVIGLIDTPRSNGAVSMTTISDGTVAAFMGEVGELTVTGGTLGEVTMMDASGAEVEFVITDDGLYVLAVAKIGDDNYATLQDAIDAAQAGETIVVLRDVTVSETLTIPAGKAVTLDLNGKTISQEKACTASYSMIENNGSLTITGNGKISFKDTGAGDPNAGWGSYTITNRGTLVVENGTIEHLGEQNQAGKAFAHTTLAIFQYSGSTTINGGTISTPNYRSIRLWSGDVTINGGTFDGQVWVHCVNDTAKMTITGGNFSPNGNDGSSVFVNNTGYRAELSVTGGTFETRIGANDVDALAGAITGGSFTEAAKNETNAALIADGYLFPATADANGYYVVIDDETVKANYEAKIGTIGYKTLADAIAAAQDGDTIVLLADIALSETVKVNANVTLDLNGKTITGTDNATGSFALIEIQPGAELTINDTVGTGKITLKANNNRGWNSYSAVVSNQRGKLIVESGTIEHLGGTDMAYGIDNLTNGKGTYAETVINGGYIKSTYRGIRQFLNGIEAQNILTINGGTVEGANKSVWMQDPSAKANSGTLTIGENAVIKGDVYLYVTEGSTEWPVKVSISATALADGVTVLTGNVPAGYELNEVNGTYGVYSGVAKIGNEYYKTLQAAIDAAKNGDTITLLTDCAEDVTIVQAPDVKITIDGADKTYTGTITVNGKSAAYETAGLTIKNVNFDATNISKDASINLGGNNNIRYTSNVTVQNCTFTDNDKTAVGIKNYTGGCKNLTITGCTATGMHSLAQLKGVGGLNVSDVTITGCKNGISVGTSTNVTITSAEIVDAGYGIRMDASVAAEITIEDCSIQAFVPVVVREASNENYIITFEGTNTLTPSADSDGYAVVVGESEYEAGVALPADATAVITITGVAESAVWQPVTFLKGSGTETDPYQISNLEDLIFFRDSVNKGETKYNAPGVYVALMNNIDMASVDWSVNIGDDCNATFDGIFDGNNKTIYNLNSTETAAKSDGYICTGLFGAIYGSAVVKNLTIENVTINTGDFIGNNVGAVVGFAYSCTGSIENVHVIGDIQINAKDVTGVGAIVGYAYGGSLTVEKCTVVGDDGSVITGAAYVGGIIGYAGGKTTVSECSVKNVSINATSCAAGGIAGIMLNGGEINYATVENVALTSAHENWKNAAGVAVGTITGAITVSDTTYSNVTANGVATSAIVGSEHKDKPTEPVAKVAASIGNKYYATLATAISAAKDGDIIVLVADVDLTCESGNVALVIDKDITIDGNYHTITFAQKAPTVNNNYRVFNVIADVNFKNLTIDLSESTHGSWSAVHNRAINILSGASAVTLENVDIIAGIHYGVYIYDATNATVTIKDSSVSGYDALSIWTDCTVNVINTDLIGKAAWNYTHGVINVGGGAPTIIVDADSSITALANPDNGAYAQYAVYVQSAATAKNIAINTTDITKVAETDPVIYLDGAVAKIGNTMYATLAEALAAAQDGETITLIWNEGDAPIAMNGAVYGKTVTITGTATVDWSKGFLFIGRGGAGNGTVIFDNANLTSASDSSSYGIHVSGREKGTADKYDGTLIINDSTIELDYLINKGTMTLDNSTLTVKNGFSIGGRPASETESGEDATATITLNNGSKVVVNNHNGMGLGYEAIGVMNVDATSTFETTQAFLVTGKGTLNVNGGTVKVAGTLTNNGIINLTDTSLTDMIIEGTGTTYFYGDINFYGANEVTSGINGSDFELIVNKGATLLISRFVLGYNRNITVYGDITDAHAFDPTGVTPSLKFNSTSGVSVGGYGTGNLTVKDAYVELDSSSWKNATGTYTWSFENSYVSATSFTNNNAQGSASAEGTVTFDDSVLAAKNYIKNGVGTTYKFINGSDATTGSLRIDGELYIDETSSVTTTAQQNNKVGAVDEHGGINGKVTVDGLLTIGSTSKTQLEMLDGELIIGKDGKLDLVNNTLTIDAASELTIDATGMTSGEYTGIEGTVVNNGTIEVIQAEGLLAEIDENGYVVLVEAAAKIGDVYYATFEEALAAASADPTITRIEILRDQSYTVVENTSDYYDISGNLTIGVPAGTNYTVTLDPAGDSIAVRVMGNGASLTIEEGLTIKWLDVVADGFATTNERITINGTLYAVSLKGWTNNNGIVIGETGMVVLGRGDGQLDLAYGNSYLTIIGNGDKTEPQFKAGYSGTRGNGNAMNLTNTYFEAGAWFTINGSNGTFNIDNSIFKVSGGDATGKLTIASSGNVFKLTNGSIMEVGVLTLGEGNTVVLGAGSSIKATTISGAGEIVIDANGLTAGNVPTIIGDASGFTGTIEVINNSDLIAKVENGKIVLINAVAKIGNVAYETLQAAIDAVKNGETITLLTNCAEDVTIVQAPDVAFTIDGNYKTFTGTITVNGKSAAYATAGLTIKNVKFDATNISKDASINLGGNNNIRYTSNVTVENCTFTDDDKTAVGIKNYTGGCKNLTITGCTATGMHSLAQLKGVGGLNVSGCTITDCKNGISVGTSTNVSITNATITATGYGIRADGIDAYDMTVGGVTIKANDPIVVRKATAAYELTLEGTNNLTATNAGGYQVTFTSGDDGTYEAPTGDFTFTNNGSEIKVYPTSDYVASVDGENFFTLEEALKAVKDNSVVTFITDITISDKWDCRYNGAKITAKNVTINGNGKKLILTGAVDDKNWNTVFRFEGDNATVKNLTIDASAATGIQRGISAKLSIEVDNCTFIGNGTSARRAIIFGEGAGDALSSVTATITNSKFVNWSYGVSDNQSGKDAYSVTITGNTFENASVLVSASKSVGFNDNTVDNGYVNITSYTVPYDSTVNATGNTLDGDYAEDNKIKAKYINAQSDFAIASKVSLDVNGTPVYFETLQEALDNVGDGDAVITLHGDVTHDYNAREAYGLDSTTSITFNGNGHTLTLNQKDSDWSSFGMKNANGKLIFNNVTIDKVGYGDTDGAWNTHAINFTSYVEMNDVVVNQSMSVDKGATLNDVTINEADGYYGLWIDGNGQTVTINGGEINATNGGRGIKIADQYVDSIKQVTLNVTGMTFNTAKKAAVLVSSTAGAKVTANGCDITNVAEDSQNFVWVDEDWAGYYNNVKVYDEATKSQENVESFPIVVYKSDAQGTIRAYFKTLDELFAAKATQIPLSDNYIELRGDVVAENRVNVGYSNNYYYNFGTSVPGGVTMTFEYADNWNYLPHFGLGENITMNVPYLQVIGGDIEIAGTVNTNYLYLYGTGEGVAITETGVVNANSNDATVQVKGGTVLTVNGTLNAGTLNVWTQDGNNSELIVSGEKAAVNVNHFHAWNGKDGSTAQKVVVEDGATLAANNFQADRGSEVTLDAATLIADSITLGYGDNVGKLTAANGSEIELTNGGTLNVGSAGVLDLSADTKTNIVAVRTEANGVETHYTTLVAAIEDVQTSDVITLKADVALTESVKVTTAYTFDLNGYTLTGPDDGKAHWYAFIVDVNGDLTLTDSKGTGMLYGKCYGIETKGGNFTLDGATIIATQNKTLGCAIVNYGGTVTIKSGKLAAYMNAIHTAGYFADAHTIIEDGNITITEGLVYIGDYGDTYAESIKSASNKYEIDPDYKWAKDGSGYVLIYAVAQVGDNYYTTLDAAFEAAKNGDEVIILKAGTYALTTSGKDITITGAVDGVVFDNIGAKNMGGANVTFNNVTFDYYPNVNYTGLQHSGNLVYNNCTFNGQVFLYGESETFNNCTFNQNSADAYNVWTYGAKEVEFNGCTFNSAGKSVLIYAEGASITNDVTVTDCDFIASAPVDGKAAIEMDSSLTAGIKLTIDADTTATGFGSGNVSGNSLWNNKKGNNTDANNDITVVVNGETVLAPVTFVAKIGEIGYTSIADAIKAANGGEIVTILAGDYTTNVDVNKDIDVIGETDDQGNSLVNITGKLNITADGATVKNLNVNNGSSSAGYINAKDVLVENCTVVGGNGFRYCYTTGTVIFKDSTITGSTYGIHFDGSADGNIVIDNCVITGWTSFASAITKVTISNTTFAEGNYNKLRFYQNAELTNVKFNPNMSIDFGKENVSASFNGCSVTDGSALFDVIYLPDLTDMGIKVTVDGDPVVAVINGEQAFLTLADAIKAAKSGDVVDLLGNSFTDAAGFSLNGFTLKNGSITFKKGARIGVHGDVVLDNADLTFDMDGTSGYPNAAIYVNGGSTTSITLKNGSDVLIKNPGYTAIYNDGSKAYALNIDNSTLTIEGKGTSTGMNIADITLTNGAALNTSNTGIAINGGSVTVDGTSAVTVSNANSHGITNVVLTVAAGGKVDVDNCIYLGLNIQSGSVIADGAIVTVDNCGTAGNYVGIPARVNGTTGYENLLINGKTIVAMHANGNSFTSIADAIAAAKDGDIVKLLADVALDAPITIKKSITLDGDGHKITQSDDCNNEYALLYFDAADVLDVTVKNVTFDGIKGGAAIRTLGANMVIDNCVFQNGQHTQVQGLVRLTQGKATVTNSKFLNNTCNMVISFNYDTAGLAGDTFTVDNCVFEGNTANSTAIVYYVKGDGCTIKDSEFIDNNVNCTTNGATVYLGFMENCVVTGNLFENNEVVDASTSTRVAGAIFFGYEAEISGNAFKGNTATNANGDVLGQVCTSTYYDCDIDLSGNYWGGEAPVYGKDYTIQHQTGEAEFNLNDYYTSYSYDENGMLVLGDKQTNTFVAQIGTKKYTSITDAINAAKDGDYIAVLLSTDEAVNIPVLNKEITISGVTGVVLTGGINIGIDNHNTDSGKVYLTNLTFEGKGVSLKDLHTVYVTACDFRNIAGNAIYVQADNYTAFTVIESNVIDGATGAGVRVRSAKFIAINHNEIRNVGNNGITLESALEANNSNVFIADNVIENWANGQNEGRAIRIHTGNGSATKMIIVNNNVMIKDNAPEEFVKITGDLSTSTVSIDKNYWNGFNPAAYNEIAYFTVDGINPENYYADAALQNLVTIGYVAQIGNKKYVSLPDALEAAKAGDTIVLLETAVIDSDLTIENVTIKAEGFNPAIRIVNDANVIVNNVTIESSGYAFILGASDETSAGNLTINSGSFKAGVTVASVTKGTLTINGGAFRVDAYENGQNFNFMLNCIDANYRDGSAKIVVNGGTFYNFNPADNAAEGAYTSFVADGYHSMSNGNGSFTVSQHSLVVIPAIGATCTADGLTAGEKCEICGEITKAQEIDEATGLHTEKVVTVDATCTANGFTYSYCTVCDMMIEEPKLLPMIAHNYVDGVCTVCQGVGEAVAAINGVKYTTLEKAIEAAKNGDIIELLSNVKISDRILVTKKITIDLNNKKLYIGSGTVFTVDATGDLTLTNGIIDGFNQSNGTILNAGGKLTLNDGVAVNTELQVKNISVLHRGGTLVVNGGTYLNKVVINDTATIYAGTFTGEITVTNDEDLTIYGGTFAQNVTTWCAEGYHSVDTDNDGMYVVEKHSYDHVVIVDPTCTAAGSATYTCVCGDSYTVAYGAAAGHSNVVAIEGKAPTCTETGLTTGSKCLTCGEILVKQEEIPALGRHTEEIIPAVAPTYNSTGLTAGVKCSVCGVTLVPQEIVPMLTAVAQVNGTNYDTLAAAFAAAQAGETITLLTDATGSGVVINKDITIDFAGYTYTFNAGVGSTGTESNGFQILTGNTVTLKNGTLNVAASEADKFYILVQNYADLTVTDMILDGTNLDKWSKTDGDSYTLSNNSGNVVVNGNTTIIANNDGALAYAFDACAYGSYTLPTVTVSDSVKVIGNVEAPAKVGSTYYATFAQAYAAAQAAGETLVLLETAVIDSDMIIENVTIVAEGFNPAIRIVKGATVTVKNVTVEASSYAFILGASDQSSAGNLTVESGNFMAATTVASVTKGILTINGGEFSADPYQGSYAYVINCIDANYKNGTAQVVISGGKFRNFDPQSNAAEGANTNFVADGYYAKHNGDGTWTVLEQTDVTIVVDDATKTYGNLDPAFTYTVNGKQETLPGLTVEFDRVAGENAGTYTINATVTADRQYNVKVVPGKLTIEKKNAMIYMGNITYVKGNPEPDTFQHTFKGILEKDVHLLKISPVDIDFVTVNTHEYTVEVTISNNYNIIVYSGTVTVYEAVAQIGNTYYATFDEAYDVAKESDATITLLAPVVITEDTTLDLAGLTITSSGDAFVVEDDATLTINGDGIVEAGTSGVGSWCAVWANGGHAIINGGTYSVGGDTSTTDTTHQNDVIYTKNGGTVVINGGTFLNDGTVWTLNENDSNRNTITVKGGTFENWDPMNNVSEGAGTSFVADGYRTIREGDNYVVTTRLLGDASGDGKIDTLDVIMILDYTAGLIDETQIDLAAADFNGDGRVNSRDVKKIREYLAAESN